jgi:hypothetical protein
MLDRESIDEDWICGAKEGEPVGVADGRHQNRGNVWIVEGMYAGGILSYRRGVL